MNKKAVYAISILVNVLLAITFVGLLPTVKEKLTFEYVERETIRPDSLRKYLEWEEYGVAASLSHPIRGGAEIDENDRDYYVLGEYADLLFLKRVFEKAGNAGTATACEGRLREIRKTMPEYKSILDKIDRGVERSIRE